MVTYIFGYGSLINLDSASRTLKRTLTKDEVMVGWLNGYERNWLLWDNVFSVHLERSVRGVFLNVSENTNQRLNGVLIKVNDDELNYFRVREKNYDCVDVTALINADQLDPTVQHIIYTFVGKRKYLLTEDITDSYIFQNYIDIVFDGVNYFHETFVSDFKDTTLKYTVSIISGGYKFDDVSQQGAR